MQQLIAIQILRAFAAAMVVFNHAQNDAGRTAAEAGAEFARAFPLPWASGVDLFFVVSGFVMVFSSEKLFATPGGGGAFLRRRIARIAPMYWIATSIFLVAVLRGAGAGKVPAPSFAEIVASFAFAPWPRAIDGAPRPIHSLGWTLEYEMFFYFVFAIFLWLPRARAVGAVAGVLLAFVVWHVVADPQNVALAFWSDPIVLEFAAGMGIALAFRRGLRLSVVGAALLGAAGVVALALDPMHAADEAVDALDPNGFMRLFSWGAPMAAIFAAATLGPAPSASPFARALAKIGDASYALYLFHPLALILMRKAWIAAHFDRAFGYWPLVAVSCVASIALALAVYRWVETPVTRIAQRLLVRNAPARSAEARVAQG
ncbi:MAG: acyltransferase [Hyphomicrobiales bacterium]|nr:acyltransferase [Hyphomicrobiales bacterium]